MGWIIMWCAIGGVVGAAVAIGAQRALWAFAFRRLGQALEVKDAAVAHLDEARAHLGRAQELSERVDGVLSGQIAGLKGIRDVIGARGVLQDPPTASEDELRRRAAIVDGIEAQGFKVRSAHFDPAMEVAGRSAQDLTREDRAGSTTEAPAEQRDGLIGGREAPIGYDEGDPWLGWTGPADPPVLPWCPSCEAHHRANETGHLENCIPGAFTGPAYRTMEEVEAVHGPVVETFEGKVGLPICSYCGENHGLTCFKAQRDGRKAPKASFEPSRVTFYDKGPIAEYPIPSPADERTRSAVAQLGPIAEAQRQRVRDKVAGKIAEAKGVGPMLTEYGDGMLTCQRCGLDAPVKVIGGEPTVRFFGVGGFVLCRQCGSAGPRCPTVTEGKEAWNRIQRALEAAVKFGTCDGFTYAEAEKADAAYRARLAAEGEEAPATTYGRLDRCPSCRVSIEHARDCKTPGLYALPQLVQWLKDEFYTNVGASSEADAFWSTLHRGAELGLWPEDQDDWKGPAIPVVVFSLCEHGNKGIECGECADVAFGTGIEAISDEDWT